MAKGTPVHSGNIIAKLIAAGMLFAALGRHSYDYYTTLRWVVCGVAAFSAYQALKGQKVGWLLVLAIVAIAFNPVAPLRLTRGAWTYLDGLAGALLLLSITDIDIGESRR